MIKKIALAAILALTAVTASAKSKNYDAPSPVKPCFVIFGSTAINVYTITAIYEDELDDDYIRVERAARTTTKLFKAQGQTTAQAVQAVVARIKQAEAECNK